VGDEVLAGLPPLVGMALAREGEGSLDGLGVDRPQVVVAVLGDDREEVAEQRAVGIGQVGRALAVKVRWLGGDAPRSNPRMALAVGGCFGVLGSPPRRPRDFDLRSAARLRAGRGALAVRAVLRRRALRALRLL
jgi:hypothetical protein